MTIDEWHMKLLAKLIADLKSVREDEDTLLDRTMVLYGSNFGDANAHTCFNMPTLLAGGGFKHGQHYAFRQRPQQLPAAQSLRLHAPAHGPRGATSSPRPPARCADSSWHEQPSSAGAS